ncbi:AAA family ATPase [Roseibium sp. M-1]
MQTDTTLHLLCGKIASGKSTLAARLAAQPRTVVISEDAWLSGLFAEDLRSISDYVRFSARLRQTIAPHIVALLRSGMSVVLDFQANTKDSRRWMRELAETAGCRHLLHFLDIPDDTCRQRLKHRNATGQHEFSVTEADFDRITGHFQPPSADEGSNLKIYLETD